jgi:hypothetical protein
MSGDPGGAPVKPQASAAGTMAQACRGAAVDDDVPVEHLQKAIE